MSHQTAALPIAYVVLRILLMVTWLLGACILGLLIFSFINEPFLLKALQMGSVAEDPARVWGVRGLAGFGVVAIILNLGILKRLLAMVETVKVGDPFVAANAFRLHAIAWLLLGLQLVGLAIAAIGRFISTPENPVQVDAGFSVNGWLAVILTFVLARVFAEGTLMREDLEGTV